MEPVRHGQNRCDANRQGGRRCTGHVHEVARRYPLVVPGCRWPWRSPRAWPAADDTGFFGPALPARRRTRPSTASTCSGGRRAGRAAHPYGRAKPAPSQPTGAVGHEASPADGRPSLARTRPRADTTFGRWPGDPRSRRRTASAQPRVTPRPRVSTAGHQRRPAPDPDRPGPVQRRQPVRHVPPGLRRRHGHRLRGGPPARRGRPQADRRADPGRRLVATRGHCGAPSTDFIEHVHIVVFERRLGRLQAHSFSYSGNPQGCDHAVRHLHTVLENLQAKLSRPADAGRRRPRRRRIPARCPGIEPPAAAVFASARPPGLDSEYRSRIAVPDRPPLPRSAAPNPESVPCIPLSRRRSLLAEPRRDRLGRRSSGSGTSARCDPEDAAELVHALRGVADWKFAAGRR